MSELSQAARDQAEKHIAAMIGALRNAELGVRLHGDAEAFRAFALNHDGHEPASPLNHAYVQLDHRNFFWIQIIDAAQNPVAIAAARILNAPASAGGLDALIASQALFADRLPMLYTPPFFMPPTGLCGRMGYLGGGWTDPAWRGRNLIGFAVQLATAHMVRHHGIDHAVGFVRPAHQRLAMSRSGYGFTRQWQTRTEYCAGTGHAEVLHLAAISRQELLERYAAEPAYPRPLHPAPSLWSGKQAA